MEEAQSFVDELQRRVAALETALEPLLAADSSAAAPEVERARLSLTLGHAAAALFVIHERVRGTSVDGEHPARAALERVSRYMRSAEVAVAPPRNAVLDRAAAGRFVTAALGRGDAVLRPGAS
jgi:hypothetical protein